MGVLFFSAVFMFKKNGAFWIKFRSLLITSGCWTKNRGKTPQIIHFNRVFHYKPSILVVFPLFFGSTPKCPRVTFCFFCFPCPIIPWYTGELILTAAILHTFWQLPRKYGHPFFHVLICSSFYSYNKILHKPWGNMWNSIFQPCQSSNHVKIEKTRKTQFDLAQVSRQNQIWGKKTTSKTWKKNTSPQEDGNVSVSWLSQWLTFKLFFFLGGGIVGKNKVQNCYGPKWLSN